MGFLWVQLRAPKPSINITPGVLWESEGGAALSGAWAPSQQEVGSQLRADPDFRIYTNK
jgi:hypothetical protein